MTLQERTDLLLRRVEAARIVLKRAERGGNIEMITKARERLSHWMSNLACQRRVTMGIMSAQVHRK